MSVSQGRSTGSSRLTRSVRAEPDPGADPHPQCLTKKTPTPRIKGDSKIFQRKQTGNTPKESDGSRRTQKMVAGIPTILKIPRTNNFQPIILHLAKFSIVFKREGKDVFKHAKKKGKNHTTKTPFLSKPL